MVAVVVVAPDWSGAVVVDVVSLLVPSEFVVVEVEDEEPSWFVFVSTSVWLNEPSSFVVLEVVVVVVVPSWFWTIAVVDVVIEPSSLISVVEDLLETYTTFIVFEALYPE